MLRSVFVIFTFLLLVYPMSASTAVSEKKLVLLHGFFQSGKIYHPLATQLRAQGVDCLIPALKPADARGGIAALALQLRSEIDAKWGQHAAFSVVGYSMGGVVARYYLQELGGYKRCENLITLAAPHHGSYIAHLYPGKGAYEMRPGSELLKLLESSEHRLKNIQVSSFRTPFDLVIIPYTSSEWSMAENHISLAPAHPLIIFSPKVRQKILSTMGCTTTL